MNTNSKLYKHQEKYEIIGLNIAYYRKKNKLTQEQLADLVGISRVYLGKIEAPGIICIPSLPIIFDIADALNIHPSLLFIEK